MAGGEVESVGGRMEWADSGRRRDGRTSPGLDSKSRGRSGDGSGRDLESPARMRRSVRGPFEEYSDYSEEKEEHRRHSRREERVEKESDRGTERRRHEPLKERTRSAVGDVELNSTDDRDGDRRKRERHFSSANEDSGEDEVVEVGAKVGRSVKASKNRRHDTSEDGSEEDEIVGGTLTKKSRSRIREKSGRHGVSDDDGSDEDEVVTGTPTKRNRSGKHSDRKSSEKSRKLNDRKPSRRRRRRARSYSSDEDSSESDESSSSSSGISETEDEAQREKERRRRKKRRRKEREREQEKEIRRKEKRKTKELKEKKLRSEKKKKKREMRSKQPITTSWGKYGIIKDIDMWNKRPEFSAWLAEVNMETLSNWEEKQMFKEYMEDYNTATFPSKKYYNLDIYHRRKIMKARMKGMAKVGKAERVDFNDEEQRRQELRKEREQKKEEDVEALMRTMQSGMAQAMRDQAQLREEMQYQFRLGNVEAAQAIQRRLDPDADKLAKM